MPLSIGVVTADAGTMAIQSNSAYTVTIKDKMDGAKPSGSEGKMAAITFSTGTWSGTSLGAAMQASTGTGTFVSLTGADQVIRSGSAESFNGPVHFKQVVAPSDPVLPNDQVYRISTLITGAANP
jgi:hypothetical protein